MQVARCKTILTLVSIRHQIELTRVQVRGGTAIVQLEAAATVTTDAICWREVASVPEEVGGEELVAPVAKDGPLQIGKG